MTLLSRLSCPSCHAADLRQFVRGGRYSTLAALVAELPRAVVMGRDVWEVECLRCGQVYNPSNVGWPRAVPEDGPIDEPTNSGG